MGAAERQAARHGVRLIAELLDLRQDARASGLADVVVIVQDLRDGGDRHTELAGNPLHRGRVHRTALCALVYFTAKVD